jgi:sporulation integral membrane protein YtvI
MSLRTILIIAAGLAFLYGLFTVGFPFLLAIVIAIFIEPLNQLLMKYTGMSRIAAATINCSLVVVLLLVLLYLIGMKIWVELVAFLRKAPEKFAAWNDYFQDTVDRTKILYETLPPEFIVQLQNVIDGVTSSLTGLISTTYRAILNLAAGLPGLFIFFLVFLIALYLFSFSLTTLKSSFLSLFAEQSRGQVDDVLQNLRKSIFGFIRAQIILSAMTYCITLTGLLILGANYPMAIALLIVIVDLLPILGTGSVLVPWALFEIVMYGNYYVGFGLIILFLAITVFRRIVEPKILGDAVGISPLAALISLYVGLELVGVVGLFLGPIIVIIYNAMRRVGLLNIRIKLD